MMGPLTLVLGASALKLLAAAIWPLREQAALAWAFASQGVSTPAADPLVLLLAGAAPPGPLRPVLLALPQVLFAALCYLPLLSLARLRGKPASQAGAAWVLLHGLPGFTQSQLGGEETALLTLLFLVAALWSERNDGRSGQALGFLAGIGLAQGAASLLLLLGPLTAIFRGPDRPRLAHLFPALAAFALGAAAGFCLGPESFLARLSGGLGSFSLDLERGAKILAFALLETGPLLLLLPRALPFAQSGTRWTFVPALAALAWLCLFAPLPPEHFIAPVAALLMPMAFSPDPPKRLLTRAVRGGAVCTAALLAVELKDAPALLGLEDLGQALEASAGAGSPYCDLDLGRGALLACLYPRLDPLLAPEGEGGSPGECLALAAAGTKVPRLRDWTKQEPLVPVHAKGPLGSLGTYWIVRLSSPEP